MLKSSICIGDIVLQKTTISKKTGVIIGIIENDIYFEDKRGIQVFHSSQNEYKVWFEGFSPDSYIPLPLDALIKI